jgi:hypothetical protein
VATPVTPFNPLRSFADMALTNYLADEATRNHKSVKLFADMLRVAYPEHKVDILIGHHICFMFNDDFDTMDEIPAADSLIFDPELMGRVFGSRAKYIMARLAVLSIAERDSALSQYFYEAHPSTAVLINQYAPPVQLHEV